MAFIVPFWSADKNFPENGFHAIHTMAPVWICKVWFIVMQNFVVNSSQFSDSEFLCVSNLKTFIMPLLQPTAKKLSQGLQASLETDFSSPCRAI